MTLYAIILFLHVASALGLFAAGSIRRPVCLWSRWDPFLWCSFQASS